jgi:hypothetical protein
MFGAYPFGKPVSTRAKLFRDMRQPQFPRRGRNAARNSAHIRGIGTCHETLPRADMAEKSRKRAVLTGISEDFGMDATIKEPDLTS